MGVNKIVLNTDSGEARVLVDLTGDNVTADSLVVGSVAHGADGEIVEGANPYELEATNAEVGTQSDLIAQIAAVLDDKAAVGGGIIPTGTIQITENGTHDVTNYATAEVNVPSSGGESIDGIPAGYARCDFIQFTGEQIIDTGIVCTQDTEIKVAFTREKSTQHYLYGVASSDNTASVTAYLDGSWRFGNKTATKNPTTNADMIYSGVVDSSRVTITGSASTISGVNEFETVGTLILGSSRGASGSIGSAQFEGKVFFFAMRQGDEQVLKLVPVVSADGEYRFWDMVSKSFFDSITDTPLEGGNL